MSVSAKGGVFPTIIQQFGTKFYHFSLSVKNQKGFPGEKK